MSFFLVFLPRRYSLVLAIGLLASSCQSSTYDLPFTRPEGGALTVRGHYFFFREKPLMVIGDSATQSVMQNLNLDYQAWLDDLAANKIRFAMIWSWMPVKQNQDGSRVDSRWGYVVPVLTPWERSTKGIARDGLPHWDLQHFDERYWQRLEDICRAALQRDILLLIVIFDGWAKDFAYHPFNQVNGGPLADVRDGREGFATLFDYNREILSETPEPSWPPERLNQYYQERFADRLLQVTAPYDNVFYELYNEGSVQEEYDRHFVEFVGRRTNKPLLLNDDFTPFDGRRHPLVDVISWHTDSWRYWRPDSVYDPLKVNERWRQGFPLTPVKPIINTETVPEYYGGRPAVPSHRVLSDSEVVHILWATLVAGGGLFLQDDTVFAFDPNAPAVGKGEGRRYLGYASRFIEEQNVAFWQMAPGESIIAGGMALAAPGHEYLIYVPEGGKAQVDLSRVTARPYMVHWYDPTRGASLGRTEIDGGRIHDFTFPASPLVAHIKIK